RLASTYLRPNLELTAGNLSQHLGVLENAALITIEKSYAGKRARTWITLTKAGQAALAEGVTNLKLLISHIERADTQHNVLAMPGGPPAGRNGPAGDARNPH